MVAAGSRRDLGPHGTGVASNALGLEGPTSRPHPCCGGVPALSTGGPAPGRLGMPSYCTEASAWHRVSGV